jgi:RNA polymerase sigma-70 factor (ECF subfamily)
VGPDYLEVGSFIALAAATRGELLRRLGRTGEARAAVERALALAHDESERRLLAHRLADL